jgi:tetratricopeptide (TPR) repeat protein
VLRTLTGIAPDSLDALFTGWLRTRFAAPLRALASGNVGVINSAMEDANDALARSDTAEAIAALREARERFPELGQTNGAGMPLAIVLWRQGDRREALAELAVVTGGDETALDANLLEAEWRLETGDSVGALRALERASWIAPNSSEVWSRRAEVAALARRPADVVQARRALLYLRPTDVVAARTDLAEALIEAGDAAGARRELLGVLERAPGYERAQMLLLRARQL